MHDRDKCTSCDVIKPVLKYADVFIQPLKTFGVDYQPVTADWNQFHVMKFDADLFLQHPSTFLPVHPTLQNCVLLI
jgi:hypothetical protein